jgi:hypothetical protein
MYKNVTVESNTNSNTQLSSLYFSVSIIGLAAS